MGNPLSQGCVLALFQEEEPQAPVVQVINHKAVLNPSTGQERYRWVFLKGGKEEAKRNADGIDVVRLGTGRGAGW